MECRVPPRSLMWTCLIKLWGLAFYPPSDCYKSPAALGEAASFSATCNFHTSMHGRTLRGKMRWPQFITSVRRSTGRIIQESSHDCHEWCELGLNVASTFRPYNRDQADTALVLYWTRGGGRPRNIAPVFLL